MSNIKSMTAFASIKGKSSICNFNIDLKTINSRFLDINFKLPENIYFIEADLTNILKDKVSRGKIECSISLEKNDKFNFNINTNILNNLKNQIAKITESIPNISTSAIEILNFPGVMNNNHNFQDLAFDIKNSFSTLVDTLNKYRLQEGSKLIICIEDKLDGIEQNLLVIKDNLDNLVERERKKIQEKLNKLMINNINEDRLEFEITLLAQKSDIAEEYDRINSHIKTTREIIKSGGLCGKRLDFMMQEFYREANTIASKASNIDITRASVEIKVLIEQIREQVQNIE